MDVKKITYFSWKTRKCLISLVSTEISSWCSFNVYMESHYVQIKRAKINIWVRFWTYNVNCGECGLFMRRDVKLRRFDGYYAKIKGFMLIGKDNWKFSPVNFFCLHLRSFWGIYVNCVTNFTYFTPRYQIVK